MTSKEFYTKTTSTLSQISYTQVRSSLLFLCGASFVLYVMLVIFSTATISHSKVLVSEIRDHQGAITELNGALAIKNQDLAVTLQENNEYVTPKSIAYINKADVINQPLALER